jgi:predicted NUDIX family NTP pyrophosphohydrolase
VSKHSAGILLFRRDADRGSLVLLGHMGGPLWAGKDEAAWSIPKGLVEDGEDAAAAAHREFTEELGLPVPDGELLPLGDLRASGKLLTIWALEADLDVTAVVPGTFNLEWPPRSGQVRQYPEVDRTEWFDLEVAAVKLVKGQRPYLDRLRSLLGEPVKNRQAPDAPTL